MAVSRPAPRKNPGKILVVRNDKLGDFMLSLPALELLRRHLPDTEIHALVRDYTRPMAELSNAIDVVQIDPGPEHGMAGLWQLAGHLRRQHYDAAITLFSTSRIGLALALAGIPVRLAPATKLAQLFYNRRLRQHRSASAKPEYEYNRDLAEYYLQQSGIPVREYPAPPYLAFEKARLAALRQQFCQRHGIDTETRLVFLHPGSGGSARNLSPERYGELAMGLQSPRPWRLIISAGPGEEAAARGVAERAVDLDPILYLSSEGLTAFTEHLALADVFISGSTGPLHIAGALDRPTAAFYPRRRSATPLRWRPLNSTGRHLAFTPPQDAGEEDMSAIDVQAAARAISHAFL